MHRRLEAKLIADHKFRLLEGLIIHYAIEQVILKLHLHLNLLCYVDSITWHMCLLDNFRLHL